MKKRTYLAFVVIAAVLVPADNSADDSDAAFAAPTDLVATLADPINIDLKWKDNATSEAGYFVEYSPDANDEYAIIDALPENSMSYRHPDLLPETRFVFRVRPFFGKASNSVEVTTGKEAEQQTIDEGEPAAKKADGEATASLKSPQTIAQAAPSDLKVTLIPPAGVKLEWKDNAKDEEGYLVEIKPSDESEFKVSTFLDPNTTSLVTYGFPFETKFDFRVRAYWCGKASNLAEKTTGADPTMVNLATPSSAPGVR